MTPDVLAFFSQHMEALPLYERFAQQVLAETGEVRIKVQKTQIAFANRHNFAFVSFLPVRKAKERPEHYIVVTIGLGRRLDSPRVDAAVEPYPNRWTHHILIASPEEIDGELMGWIREASSFAADKR